MLISIAMTTTLLLLFPAVPAVLGAVLCAKLMGITSGITMVHCQGQVQSATPPALLGRVTAVLTLLTLGLSPLAYAGVGVIVDVAGLPVFFAAAAALVAAAGVFLTVSRFGPRERPVAAPS